MESYAVYLENGIILASGLVDRDKDQQLIAAGDKSTVVESIEKLLQGHSNADVWYGPPSDLPKRRKYVIDLTTLQPRPATEAELAQMPEGVREEKHNQADIRLQELSSMTYQDADDWIENSVTDLASAKTAMKKLAKVSLALIKRLDLGE